MRRIRIVGLCIVAAFALSAIAASSASAAEYGQCLAQKKGNYTDGTCKTKSKPKKGNHEWKPGPSPSCVAKKNGKYKDAGCTVKVTKKGKFEKKACFPNCAEVKVTPVGKPKLKGEGGLAIACEKVEGKNIITGPKSGVSILVFKECSGLGKKCQNIGGPGSGEISTFALELEPYEETGKVFNRIQNKAGAGAPYLAEFECEGPGIKVKGKASALHTGDVNVMNTTATDEFASGLGEAGLLEVEACTPGCAPSGKATLEDTNTLTTVDPLGMEVKSP